jgi:hypothetical protein
MVVPYVCFSLCLCRRLFHERRNLVDGLCSRKMHRGSIPSSRYCSCQIRFSARLTPFHFFQLSGGMAVVGLTWTECQHICPTDIVPACHNALDSVTVSGPKESVAKFVEELKFKKIFVKEVACNQVAFHSYFMDGVVSCSHFLI